MKVGPILLDSIVTDSVTGYPEARRISFERLTRLSEIEDADAAIARSVIETIAGRAHMPRLPAGHERIRITFQLGAGSMIQCRLDVTRETVRERIEHPGSMTIRGMDRTASREAFRSTLRDRPTPQQAAACIDQRGEALAVAQIKERLSRWQTLRNCEDAQRVIRRKEGLPSLLTTAGWSPQTELAEELSRTAQLIVV